MCVCEGEGDVGRMGCGPYFFVCDLEQAVVVVGGPVGYARGTVGKRLPQLLARHLVVMSRRRGDVMTTQPLLAITIVMPQALIIRYKG